MKRICSYLFFFLILFTSCSHPEFEEFDDYTMILFPSEVEEKVIPASFDFKEQFLIVLDAGHGGKDIGAQMHSLPEKTLCLYTTLMTKKYLQSKGYKVMLTRGKDSYLSLDKRVAIANKSNAVLFVSIHYNASENEDAKGIEIFYYEGKEKNRTSLSKELAHKVLSKVTHLTHGHSRGVKKGNFRVIKATQMPAILVEGGFVTNQKEFNNLRNRSYLSRIALGIAEGVDEYIEGHNKLVLGAN